ncbi:ATP-dependent DNA helicase Q-like 5 [Silene latifolia]|uniref:ATP-dependent DNA helicase Q-like 5 n=1 Tax=Silene latifolia TaxID=37657 RepID=UPI003D783FAC
MESDTDSDGSHISATPPRNPFPSPPKLPNKLTQTQKSQEKPSKIQPNSTSKPSNSPQSPSKHNLQHHPFSTPTFISSNSSFSIPIRRPNYPNPELPNFNSIRAGSCSFSNSTSFSRFTKNDLNFACTEKDPILLSGSVSKPESEVHCDGQAAGFDKKVVKKPSNLIASGSGGNGSGTSLLPAKRAKLGGSEGNFVKLNINGHGRRFTFKNRNSNCNSSSSKRNSYRRNKRSWKGNNGGQSNDLGDEEGINLAAREGKKPRTDYELVKNAVLDVRNEASDVNLVKLLKLTHGYDSFREGQLEAVKMVLAQKSTMLVLPTGAGKSLCYQLPAIVFPGITLVISPLVALMIDQLKQLPSVVNGALLSSSQPFDEMSETLSLLKEGSIKVLFVSPERFLNEEFMSIISSCSLISLVVIDEAHCVSEWSHNFRPSYMRLRASVLRDKLNAECILAMTATATRKTLDAVMHALDIPSTNLVKTAQLRNNLQMSVSLSGDNKMKELIGLIKSPPYSELKSIIIYCKFKYETDKIGKYLCDNNISAMSYNSGMLAKDRSRAQALFCSNKIKVVVATVAFGMGLDKSDVGAVIHFSLPESLEEYVQEIGRAGRDGTVSYCHLLFDDIVYFKLRSLLYSDGVDEYMVNKLLCQIFSSEMRLKDETHSLIIESASRKFDMKEEVILTILTQLELGEVQYLQLLPQLNVTCSLNFHKTPSMELAAGNAVVAGILNKSENKHGLHVFDIPSVANAIGLTTTELLNHLLNLKFSDEIRFELKDPAYCYTVVKAPSDLCSLATHMTKWLSEIECCKVQKLDVMFKAATFAVKQCGRTDGCDGAQHTPCLQRRIQNYFSEEDHTDLSTMMNQNSRFLQADIKVFLQRNSSAKLTPRAVARIMHGIPSPAYPSATWSKTHFWGRYTNVDFRVIMEAAKAELMNFARKDGT